MEKRTVQTIMIVSAIVVIIGTAFIITRPLQTTTPRPTYHLAPYPGDIADVSLLTIEGHIEIGILSYYFGTEDTHRTPRKMVSCVSLNVSNTGLESIDDFNATMGTLFGEDNVAVYSFWVEMRIDGTWVQNVVVPSMNSVDLRCYDLGSLFITDEEYGNLPDTGYLRVQISIGSDSAVIITTPLQQFLHLVE